MAKLLAYLWKAGLIAVGCAASSMLAFHLTPWPGLSAWAGIMAVACAAAALLLKTSGVGRLTWKNRVAGYFLPWGFKLGQGRLVGITAVAWAVWLLIGAAAVFILNPHPPAAFPKTPDILLLLTWLIYGGLCLRQLGLIFNEFRHSPAPRKTMIVLTLIMLALVAGSGFLHLAGQSRTALLVAGGPLLLVGGGYALFVGAMLIFGRNARWN